MLLNYWDYFKIKKLHKVSDRIANIEEVSISNAYKTG